jgi:hypothetical protein
MCCKHGPPSDPAQDEAPELVNPLIERFAAALAAAATATAASPQPAA